LDVSGAATLEVLPGRLARVKLVPDGGAIGAGGVRHYTALGYDAHGNELGDYTTKTIFSISGGSCADAGCTATEVGDHTVTATVIGTPVSGSATLPVLPGRLARAELVPDGGAIGAGGVRHYTTLGYDAYGNERGDYTTKTIFSISGGSCADAGCTATKVGDYTVSGRVIGTLVSGSATLRVLPARLAELVMEPGGGAIGAGAAQRYTARGFDAYGNELGDYTTKTIFSITPGGSCAGTSCTATKAGDYTVTGRVIGDQVSGAVPLQVLPARLAELVMEPGDGAIGAGAAQRYTARGFDAYGNELGDYTTKTAFSIQPTGSCLGPSCTAAEAGGYTVTGTVIGTGVSNNARLRVLPTALEQLALDPAVGSIGTGAAQAYTARGFDRLGNELGDFTAKTAFSIQPNGTCAGASCTVSRAGDHTVTGTVPGTNANAEASLRVLSAPLDRLVLDPANSSIGAGGAQRYSARGFDRLGNELGDFTAKTVFSIQPSGSCARASCTPAKAGKHTVTGTVSGANVSADASLHVRPAALDRLVLDPPSGSIDAGAAQRYTARGFDARGNELGDFTAKTVFSIQPGGSCAGATCTAPAAGNYTVTGAVTGAGIRATADLRVAAAASAAPASKDRSLNGLPLILAAAVLLVLLRAVAAVRGRHGEEHGKEHGKGGSGSAGQPSQPPQPDQPHQGSELARPRVRTEARAGSVRTVVTQDVDAGRSLTVHLERHDDELGTQVFQEDSQ
jgi:hypothetical protein